MPTTAYANATKTASATLATPSLVPAYALLAAMGCVILATGLCFASTFMRRHELRLASGDEAM